MSRTKPRASGVDAPPSRAAAPTPGGWWLTLRGGLSARLQEAAWRNDELRQRLARHPGWLLDKDQVLLAGMLVRMNESHLLPRMLQKLGDGAQRLEPVLWMLAERHAGGRLWRDRLWRAANRGAWDAGQWRRYAALSGTAGELTADVARLAGIPPTEASRWWSPPTRVAPPQSQPEPTTPFEGDAKLERRHRVTAQLRVLARTGLETLSPTEVEGLAQELLELGQGTHMHRLLTSPPWSYKPLAAQSNPEILRLRERLGLRFHAWLLAFPALWTDVKPGFVRQQVQLLRILPSRVSLAHLAKFQLKPTVTARLGFAARDSASLRRRDIYRALEQARQADRHLAQAELARASWTFVRSQLHQDDSTSIETPVHNPMSLAAGPAPV